MKRTKFLKLLCGICIGPVLAVLWHLVHAHLERIGINAWIQLAIFVVLTFCLLGLTYYKLNNRVMPWKALPYAFMFVLWGVFASMFVAIAGHGDKLLSGGGSDPLAYTVTEANLLRSQKGLEHFPGLSGKYQVLTYAGKPQILQAGGYIMLEVKYKFKDDFLVEKKRLQMMAYSPTKGSCGEVEQENMLGKLLNGMEFASSSYEIKSLQGYDKLYVIYHKYGENKFDKNAPEQIGYTDGCYWNHGNIGYVLVDPVNNKIAYGADFW